MTHFPYNCVTLPIYFCNISHIFLAYFLGIQEGNGACFQMKKMNIIIYWGEIWRRFCQSSLILAPFSEKIRENDQKKNFSNFAKGLYTYISKRPNNFRIFLVQLQISLPVRVVRSFLLSCPWLILCLHCKSNYNDFR